jgi:putative endonuclease
MAIHNELGKQGEEMAAAWLVGQGYQLVARNWRCGRHEIDIIATKDKYLHFVEVKIRQTAKYGYPEESVTRNKFKRLQRAADEYLYQNPGHEWIQFSIVAITLRGKEEPEYFLIEDLFL